MRKIFLVIMTLFFGACENNSIEKIEARSFSNTQVFLDQSNLKTSLYDNNAEILTFKSEEVFADFMKKIVKSPVSQIKENSKLQQFYSLSNYNQDIQKSKLQNLRVGMDELIPDDEDEIVFDPYFAAVLNKNREIEIEGIRFRIVKEGLLAYLDKDLNRSKATNFV